MQERVRGVWPRIRVIGMRAGVLVLLVYGTSFYTRDWRALVPQAGPTGPGQVASRPEVVAGPLSAHLGEAPARLEPETTGALPRTAEVVARRSAAVRAKRPSATARLQAQAAALRSRGQHKPSKQADVAAGPGATTSSAADLKPSRPDTSAPSQPEEPVEFRLADRSN